MRKMLAVTACLGMMLSGPLSAATDMGLTLHQGRGAIAPSGSLGVQMRGSIRLGGKKSARAMDRVTFGLNAGPVITTKSNNALGHKSVVGNVANIQFKPGRSVTLSFAGQPMTAHYTQLGFADAQRDKRLPSGPKQNVSTLGWVGIGFGVAATVLLVAFLTCTNQPASGVDCGIAGD